MAYYDELNELTVYDYIVANGDIFKTTQLPLIFTTDGKKYINNMLKYNFRNKVMVYTEPTEVQDIIDMVIFNNNYKYNSIFSSITYNLPVDFTSKSTNSGTKTNTGTQATSGTDTKDNTGTQTVGTVGATDYTGTQQNATLGATDYTGTQTNASTGTVKDTGTSELTKDETNTVNPNDTTKSVLGFDGGELVANEKTSNSQNKTVVASKDTTTNNLTKTNDLTDLRTDALKTAVDSTDTRTDNLKTEVNTTDTRTDLLKEVTVKSDTRTDNLTEHTEDSSEDLDVTIKLEQLEKLKQLTNTLLYSVVVEDIINNLTLRTW